MKKNIKGEAGLSLAGKADTKKGIEQNFDRKHVKGPI